MQGYKIVNDNDHSLTITLFDNANEMTIKLNCEFIHGILIPSYTKTTKKAIEDQIQEFIAFILGYNG